MQLFRQFNQVGVTVLIASHDLDLISRMQYPRIMLHQGRLQASETPLDA
jgi:cell division transport system ATP-binding protein